MITDIDVKKLFPHPDNPRKDLGDLSELVESIKARGILQNLTVVPQESGYCLSCKTYNGALGKCENGHDKKERPPCSKWESKGCYTVIIGHRRLAAAKLAGLTEVPCVISDMDHKTQVATMLLENMQRNDLTMWEEANGFQMMLDLGETEKSISEKTGFSTKKVKQRVKWLDLDQDEFRKSVDRGARIQDYTELDKIKDINRKNEVLKKIGTSNFDWALKNAISEEKWEKNKVKVVAELDTFATLVAKSDGLQTVQWIYLDKPDFKKPDDAGEKKYFYKFSPPNYIYLLAEPTQVAAGSAVDEEQRKAQQEAQRKMQETKERRDHLAEISETAYQLRFEFIRDYAGKKKHALEIMEFAARALIQSDWFDYEMFEEILGIEFDEDEGLNFGAVSKEFAASPERILLIAAYCNEADSSAWTYYDHSCKYTGNAELNLIYNFLEKLGYQMSDEERALRDGTHELYVQDEEQKDGQG